MSTNYPAGPGSQSPYGYGQQPGYAGPPSNASGSGGAVVMIIIALGVVILLALACGAAAVGFLFFARASQSAAQLEAQAEVMRSSAVPQDAMTPEMGPPLEESTPAPFIPTDPARATWSYPTSPEGASGSITQQDANNWLETRTDNQTMRFTEVVRTDEYIELYDAERKLYVRLLADHMEWRRDGQEWFRGQEGSWQAPTVTPENASQPCSSDQPQP